MHCINKNLEGFYAKNISGSYCHFFSNTCNIDEMKHMFENSTNPNDLTIIEFVEVFLESTGEDFSIERIKSMLDCTSVKWLAK